MTDDNPFLTEKAWNVGAGMLPAGDHLCEISSVDGSGNSSGGYPQLEINVGNALGSIRDWIVVIDSTIGKVVQFTDAAGADRPGNEVVAREPNGYRIDQRYLDALVGLKVGVIVREEPDRLDPTKTRTRVQGYVKPDQVGSETTPASAFAEDNAFQTTPAEDDIPF